MSADVLNNFGLNAFTAASRMQLGSTSGGRRLGAIDPISAEASVDVAIAVGETRVLMALLEELAKVDQAAYRSYLERVNESLTSVSELNQRVATLSRDTESTWRVELDAANESMAELEQGLHRDLAAGRLRRDFLAVGLTAGAMLLAGVGGWYVFVHRRKQK